VNAIYDEISLLREELVDKITFENNRTKTDERLDLIEELAKEHTKRIEVHNGHIGDLFKNQGSGGHGASDGMASGEVKQMIDDLQDQMELRQIKNEADMMNQDLLDKIAKLTERLDLTGTVVQEADVERWNQASVKSCKAETDIEKIHKDLS